MIHKETDPFYKSAAWRRARASALMRDHYMCVECIAAKTRGVICKPRAADLVHHIKPLKEYPELALELDNLMSLCNRCHNRLHPEKGDNGIREPEPPMGVLIIKI